jgi:hypothetical protein
MVAPLQAPVTLPGQGFLVPFSLELFPPNPRSPILGVLGVYSSKAARPPPSEIHSRPSGAEGLGASQAR